jgi:lysophospholipase L1-like esterase
MHIPKDDTDLSDDSYDDNEDLNRLLASRNIEIPRPKVNPVVNCIFTVLAYIQFFWIHHRSETILFLILVGSVTLAVTGTIEAYETNKYKTNQKTHSIKHDYSDIKSQLELKLGNIDHWCFDGGDSHCNHCDDPTHPSSRAEFKPWGLAHMRNVHLAQAFAAVNKEMDVIFLGDSNIEALSGAFLGKNSCGKGMDGDDECNTMLAKSKSKFDKTFDKEKGGALNGLALGIAGDTSPNLLFRIQNDEMKGLKPKVWWLSIGINDMLLTSCSEEIALMGVLRNVEELMSRKDGATVVIQSILPISTVSSGQLDGKRMRHNKYYVAIKRVNEALKKFAQKHKGVKFFDATSFFTETHGSNLYLKRDLFMDKYRLSAKGQSVIIQAASEDLQSIISKQKQETPDTTTSTTTTTTTGSTSETTSSSKSTGLDYEWHNDDDFMTGYYGLDENGDWTFYAGNDDDDYF